MYQTLYRKYRPKTFSDVCGQTRITTVLRRQVQEGTLTHAYLFCGTRGTGKTTCAKILSKVANCLNPVEGEPCNECVNCLAADRGELLDILEVDAASFTGVDHIRKLCEELNFMPSQGKKRVYIIDEVHMLSIAAFNALLKTLEEPPAHALFILATTEFHKVPATVRSRCQCFTFHRISLSDIAERVLYVSRQENIPLNESGARLVARLSDGAMRDALSLLELCVGQTEVLDDEALNQLFGLGNAEIIKDLSLSTIRGDSVTALRLLGELYHSMGNLKEVLSQLLGAFRDMLLFCAGAEFETTSNRTDAQQKELLDAAKNVGTERLLYAVDVLQEALVRFDRLTVNKKTICEMALLRICKPELSVEGGALEARISALESKLAGSVSVPVVMAPVKKAGDKPKTVEQKSAEQAQDDLPPWGQTLDSPVQESPPQPVKKAQKPAPKPTSEPSGGLSYAKQLLDKLGGSDPLFASFCTDLVMEERDRTLYLYGASFTITMLKARQQDILNVAKEFSPNLTDVVFSEEKPQGKKDSKKADLGAF